MRTNDPVIGNAWNSYLSDLILATNGQYFEPIYDTDCTFENHYFIRGLLNSLLTGLRHCTR